MLTPTIDVNKSASNLELTITDEDDLEMIIRRLNSFSIAYIQNLLHKLLCFYARHYFFDEYLKLLKLLTFSMFVCLFVRSFVLVKADASIFCGLWEDPFLKQLEKACTSNYSSTRYIYICIQFHHWTRPTLGLNWENCIDKYIWYLSRNYRKSNDFEMDHSYPLWKLRASM